MTKINGNNQYWILYPTYIKFRLLTVSVSSRVLTLCKKITGIIYPVYKGLLRSGTYLKETILPEGGLYRYLYQLGEQHGGQKRRATDLIWSKNTHRLDRIVQDPGNRVLYYLEDGLDRALVREELMHVSEDTQVPPYWVSEWK